MKISEPSHLNNQMWHARLEPCDFPRWELIERHADTCAVERPVGYAGTSDSRCLAAVVTTLAPARLKRFFMVPQITRIDKRRDYTPGQMRLYAVGEHFGFDPYDWDSFRSLFTAGTGGITNSLPPAEHEYYLTAYMFLRVGQSKLHGMALGRTLREVHAEGADLLLSHRQLTDWRKLVGDADRIHVDNWAFLTPKNQRSITEKTLARLLVHFSDAERAELFERGLAAEHVTLRHLTGARCEFGLPGDLNHLLAELRHMPEHWLDSLMG